MACLLQALLGGVGNVLEVLRAEGVPAPTVRGVAWACLRCVPGHGSWLLERASDCCMGSAPLSSDHPGLHRASQPCSARVLPYYLVVRRTGNKSKMSKNSRRARPCRYIDGELLNALLLRRDCCSVSAAKVGGAARRWPASCFHLACLHGNPAKVCPMRPAWLSKPPCDTPACLPTSSPCRRP